jgi:hypothetical protein
MAADLPVYAHQSGGPGHVALMRFPGEAPYIDVSLGGREDLLTVGEAEHLARTILAQVAAARTTTPGGTA